MSSQPLVDATEEECSNCGHPGRRYPTPFNQLLCAECFENWFEAEERAALKWVLSCACGAVVKGKRPHETCTCGRVYAVFQVY